MLQKALDISILKVPAYKIKMRRGLFWYYFEHNPRTPMVKEEDDFPCAYTNPKHNNGYLFSVSYFKNRINLEMFHVLADGSGAIYFLKNIILNYLQLKHPEDIKNIEEYIEDISLEEQTEDAFKKYDDKSVQAENSTIDTEKSFAISGTLLPLGMQKVIEGSMPADNLLKTAKEYGATIGEFLTAVLIKAIHDAQQKKEKHPKPIKISLPVNLRSFFPSKTLRNFFIFVRVKIELAEEDFTLENIIAQVHTRMKELIDLQSFKRRIRYHCDIEDKFALRLVPRQIKNIFVMGAYALGETGYTTTISNLGVMKLPPEVLKYVQKGGVVMPASRNNILKVGVLTVGNKAVCNLSSTAINTEVQREFFRTLALHEIDVNIDYNFD